MGDVSKTTRLPPRRWSDPIGAPQWRMTPREQAHMKIAFVILILAILGELMWL